MSARHFARHAALNDISRQAMVTVNMPAVFEPSALLKTDSKHQGGMTLTHWNVAPALAWNAMCVDILALYHLVNTSKRAGSASELLERSVTSTEISGPTIYSHSSE